MITKTRVWQAFVMLCIIALTYSIIIATDFTVNPYRVDPYKQFKFRVKWDGQYVSGISKVNGLHRETQVVEFRLGNEPGKSRKLPGNTKHEPIVLERGVTHDLEFEKWANKIWSKNPAPGGIQPDYRKDIIIELLNEAGQVVKAYRVYGCWPSRYSAIDRLDANNTEIATEIIVLENEGWERDVSVTEPVEPSFTVPR